MIFVTVGSQKFQFNRLLKKIDDLIDQQIITEEVFAQAGASDYVPKNYGYIGFMSSEEFEKRENEADLIITHGGVGAIIGALRKGRRVIAVPRMKKYGEHVDDHQIQLITAFDDMKMIKGCLNLDELGKIYADIYTLELMEYQPNTVRIIESIEKFLNE